MLPQPTPHMRSYQSLCVFGITAGALDTGKGGCYPSLLASGSLAEYAGLAVERPGRRDRHAGETDAGLVRTCKAFGLFL